MKTRLAFLAAAVLFAGNPLAFSSVLFETGFEQSDNPAYIIGNTLDGVDGWVLEQKTDAARKATVQADLVRSGAQAAILTHQTPEFATLDRAFQKVNAADLGVGEKITIKFSLGVEAGGNVTASIRNGKVNLMQFHILNDGRMGYESGGFKLVAGSAGWERDAFYDIVFDIYLSEQRFDLTVTGPQVDFKILDQGFHNAGTAIDGIRFRNSTHDLSGFVDDVSVAIVPEASTYGLVVAGALALLLLRPTVRRLNVK